MIGGQEVKYDLNLEGTSYEIHTWAEEDGEDCLAVCCDGSTGQLRGIFRFSIVHNYCDYDVIYEVDDMEIVAEKLCEGIMQGEEWTNV